MSEREAALSAMRSHFQDRDGHGLAMNDKTFSRYLRARSYDIHKATELLENTLIWRKDFGLKEMQDWTVISTENSTGKMYVRGKDKEGRPLIIMRPKYENTNDHDGNMKHLVYNLERAVACMVDTAADDKVTLLIDYDGYSLRNAPPLKTSMETLRVLQDHYPERLNKIFMIRPPWIFYAAFSLVSPFIDPVTAAKIVMLQASAEDARDRLLQDIEAEVLESSLGGQDDRPFDSSLYLQSELEHCFHAVLTNQQHADREGK